MTPEQLADHLAHHIKGRDETKMLMGARAFVNLADLAVSVLRMIDARREAGVRFDASYNEDMLRIAVAPLAAQTFPPGPPMREHVPQDVAHTLGNLKNAADEFVKPATLDSIQELQRLALLYAAAELEASLEVGSYDPGFEDVIVEVRKLAEARGYPTRTR